MPDPCNVLSTVLHLGFWSSWSLQSNSPARVSLAGYCKQRWRDSSRENRSLNILHDIVGPGLWLHQRIDQHASSLTLSLSLSPSLSLALAGSQSTLSRVNVACTAVAPAASGPRRIYKLPSLPTKTPRGVEPSRVARGRMPSYLFESCQSPGPERSPERDRHPPRRHYYYYYYYYYYSYLLLRTSYFLLTTYQ